MVQVANLMVDHTLLRVGRDLYLLGAIHHSAYKVSAKLFNSREPHGMQKVYLMN